MDKKLQEILKDLDKGKLENLPEREILIRQAIVSTSLLLHLEQSISKTYDYLSSASNGPVDLVVRSSAMAENLPDASFAGQSETTLSSFVVCGLLQTGRIYHKYLQNFSTLKMAKSPSSENTTTLPL